MIKSNQHLNKKTFDKNIEKIPTRNGYGEGLVEAGKNNKDVVVLCADLSESTRSSYFQKEFPERYVEMGVAEQALATVAAGMAANGKIPFISSYAAFSPGRNWEQIRTTAALNDLPVKIAGAHAGISVGPDGATHQALEDIALMRAIPNMTVIVPSDSLETKKATIEAAKTKSPTYLRFAREKTPVFTTEASPFEIGKANVLWEENDPQVAIIACGPLVYEALLAAKKLSEDGISSLVINNHTIKPLDEVSIIRAARTAGAVVTVEEHQISGGLGGAVSECLAKVFPVPMEFVGMNDSFGESGSPEDLLEKYKMKASDVVKASKKAIARKNS